MYRGERAGGGGGAGQSNARARGIKKKKGKRCVALQPLPLEREPEREFMPAKCVSVLDTRRPFIIQRRPPARELALCLGEYLMTAIVRLFIVIKDADSASLNN